VDLKTILIIGHAIGAVLGVGGATMSDLMFFKSVKNLKISKTEMKFMELGSLQVWAGIALTIISAIGFFIWFPELLKTSRILAKSSIFLIILANGIFLNLWVTPFLKKHIDVNLAESESFRKAQTILVTSGAVSIISWYYVFILGTWRTIPYSYGPVIIAYFAILIPGIIVANVVGRYKLRALSKKPSVSEG